MSGLDRRRIPTLWLLVMLVATLLFARSSRGLAHGGEQHTPDRTDMPEADFVLADAMRLIAMQFTTLKDQAPQAATNPETQDKLVWAAADAQRYLRTVRRRWAPDRAFRAFADDAISAWAAAEQAAKAGDVATLTQAAAAIGGTCKACHDVYNKPA